MEPSYDISFLLSIDDSNTLYDRSFSSISMSSVHSFYRPPPPPPKKKNKKQKQKTKNTLEQWEVPSKVCWTNGVHNFSLEGNV